MTSNVRILLAQIATFELQHRAGLTPPCGALSEFFETARQVRLDVAAVDAGMIPPPVVSAPAPMPRVRDVTLEPVGDVRLASADVARFARALLDSLARAPNPRGA